MSVRAAAPVPPVLPPPDVRTLAMLAHLGPFFLFPVALGLTALERLLPWTFREGTMWTGFSMLILLLGTPFVTPAAAFLAARRSPWGPFLRSHAARALWMYALSFGLLCGWGATLDSDTPPHPYLVIFFFHSWLALVGCSVMRARGGWLAWYPLGAQLFPDPPGYVTRHPFQT